MSCSFKHTARKLTPKYPKLLTALAAAALSAVLPTAAVHAAGYSFQQHVINAGVLVNGTGPSADPSPYLFYVLNNRPDVKPTDVTLINPLAPASASSSTAAYWEVQLNTASDSQLSQYNVLYLRADGITFGPAINEKLRRFVDNGGQLIVEYGSASSVAVPGLFTGTGAGSGSGGVVLPSVAAPSTVLEHPIVSQPYFLTTPDLTGLGTPTGSITLSAKSNNLFSPVLADGSGSVVSAAQIGAGQAVVSTVNLGLRASVDSAATFVQTDLYLAPAADLKLLANILAWPESHPNGNKTSHGNASNPGLASFSPAWQVPVVGTTAPSGAAIWGNFVFVTDAAGTLHAFDAYPSENLTGGSTTDDGITDYSTGKSYDEIWNVSVGAGASAPTVAAFNNTNYVFVEKNDGSVAAYNAVTGAAGPTLTPPTSGSSFPGTAPGPTYYDGRIYAGQANGTLDVYDLNEGALVTTEVPLNPNPSSGESVTGAPAVGTLANGDTSVIVAVVSTNSNVYTVLLGARNEALKAYPNTTAIQGYSINRRGHYVLDNIFADTNANVVPSLLAYDYNGVENTTTANNAAPPSPQDPLFTITNPSGYYTDWDMDFKSAIGTGTPGVPVNLSYISASPYGEINSTTATPSSVTMSAPAIDRHSDFYYTETNGTNSYLIGVHNAPLYTLAHLKFRFLMPTSPVTDADGTNYAPLIGYHFVGAPVIDDQGNVYAAAINGTSATVLCFRGDQQVSAVYGTNNPGPVPDLTTATISQMDEGGGADNTLQRGPDTPLGVSPVIYGQYLASPNSIEFYNFGKTGSLQQIAGDLTEPQPLLASDSTGATPPVQPATLYMHTNLAWYVSPFPVQGPVTGITQVGTSVFLYDGTALYRLSTAPQVGAGKVVTLTPSEPAVTTLGTAPATGSPNVGGSVSVGGNVMVLNGLNSIRALTRQVTVIADSNRILGVDGDGAAVWAVDATTRTDLTTGASTRVALSHPTALSQFSLNDYLVADTGNNRCVRFDSAGNVQWELTRFQDPNGLMASGQPLTLSQPSSVVTRTVADPDTTNPGGSYVYYLIADSGNDRVLEVADRLSATGAIVNGISHVLTWISHTGDRDGRHYRYGNAAYYSNPTPPPGYSSVSIAATVTNTRLAPLTATGLGPVSGDAPGGSIVVFNYPVMVQPFNANAPSDLVYTTAGFYSQDQSGTYTPYTIRNPRFLQLNSSASATSPATGVPAFDFLYADDNGAFDLTYNTAQKAFIAGPDRLQFTQNSSAVNYDNMSYLNAASVLVPVPAFGVTGAISRIGLPFIPTCIQALGMDSQTTGGVTTTLRRYLITQSYGQGELGVAPTATIGKLGGEIFEVDVANTSSPAASVVTPVGGFGGIQTLSHPDLTGPLTQPTYAIRLP